MKNLNYLTIVLLVSIFCSCQKEELPVASEGTPVFSIDGAVDNSDLKIEAGKKDFYLFTSYEVDENDVMIFKGHFDKTSDCQNDCEESLSFEIRNYQQGVVNDFNIENALKVGEYNYKFTDIFTPSNPSSLVANPIGVAPFSYDWKIDGISQNQDIENLSYEMPLGVNRQKVFLEITDATGCKGSIEKFINRDQSQALQVNYEVELEPAAPFIAKLKTVVQSGQGPFFYKWDTGDQSPFINVLGGKYCVSVEDVNGDEIQVCKTVSKDSIGVPITNATGFSYCSADFEQEGELAPVSNNPFQLATIIIKYSDKNGNTFSSEYSEQSASNYFEITNVEDYELNENGDKTKKLDVRFQCQLKNGNGDSVQINQTSGSIAVAHP